MVDGSSNSRGNGVDILLTILEVEQIEQSFNLGFKDFNNESKYEAVIAGLEMTLSLRARRIKVLSDLQLIVNQINGEYETRGAKMASYLDVAKSIASRFDHFEIQQVPREENVRADALANIGSSSTAEKQTIPIGYLENPKIKSVDIVQTVQSKLDRGDWRIPILVYINEGWLLGDKQEARKLRTRATRYSVVLGKLYRRSISGPLSKCLGKEEAKRVMLEVHEGTCGNHSWGRSLNNKIKRQCYYWPTMVGDLKELVKRCDKY